MILIYVVFPDVKVLRFKVDLDVKIDRILDHIGHQYILIHNCTALLPMYTVSFYNLQQDDCIWAVLRNDKSTINRCFRKDCTLEYAHYLFNRYKKEVAEREFEETKRNDLRGIKIMSKAKKFRKLVKRFNEMEEQNYNKPIPIFETKYVKPTKPCSDPLPVFFFFSSETGVYF